MSGGDRSRIQTWTDDPSSAAYMASTNADLLGCLRMEVTSADHRPAEYAEAGDLRFAAELGLHAVFAVPGDEDAHAALADVLEQLGYGSENATWRNCFLMGAKELRDGIFKTPISQASRLAPAMSITQLFDTISLRIDGPKAWDEHLSILWDFTDVGERYWMELSNGALTHHPTSRHRDADLTVRLTKVDLLQMLATGATDHLTLDGDTTVLPRLVSLTDQPTPDFPIVTP